MRRLLLATACVLITAMPAFSQTLRIALRQDLDVLDPTLATTYVGRIVFAGLCDKLFDIDEKLNIVPQLATGYEWADDKTLVIHLRSGVKFHNGEVLDAAAVKYSLERHLTMQGSFRKSEISAIDHVEVVDPATVRIVLKSPVGRVSGAAHRPFRHDLSAEGDRGGGQGFRPASGVQRAVQVRRARAAGPCHAGALRRLLGREEHPFRQGRVSGVRRFIGAARQPEGGHHRPRRVHRADRRRRGEGRIRSCKLVVSDALGYSGITNNLDNGPRANTPYGKNALVRQAFDAAIDRAALVNVVFNGMYAPTRAGRCRQARRSMTKR